MRAFEFPVHHRASTTTDATENARTSDDRDTIIVPARKEGFEKVFLGEDRWRPIHIGGGMLDKIKFIAAYQTDPISAITHYAAVDHIEPYGEDGKYQLVFSERAKTIGPIPLADAPSATIRAPRYTTLEKLKAAKKVSDLIGKYRQRIKVKAEP